MKTFIYAIIILFTKAAFSQEYWQKFPTPTILDCNNIITNSEGFIFASTWDSTVYRSTDSGLSWKNILNLFNGTITVDKSDILYAVSDNSNIINMSTDNGDSWSTRILPDTINGIVAADSGHLFTYSYYWSWSDGDSGYTHTAKIFCTENGGETWRKIAIPTDNFNSFQVLNGNVLYFQFTRINPTGFNYEHYYSTNWGETWIQFEAPEFDAEFRMLPNGIFIAQCYYGIYRSTDMGKNWEKVHGESNYLLRVYVNPFTSDLYLISDWPGKLYKSSNIGTTWDTLSTKIPNMTDLYFTSNNLILTSQLKMSSDNGKTWFVNSDGLKPNTIYTLNIDAQNKLYANNGYESYISTDNGKLWKCSFFSDDVWFDSNSNIYQSNYSGLLRSIDSGLHWQFIYSEENRPIKKVWFDSQNNIFMLFERGGMKYSSNGGDNWKDILSFDPKSFMFIKDFEVNSFNHIFLSVNDPVYNGVFRSFDYGATLFAQTSLTSNLVDQLVVDSKNKIYAVLRSQWENGILGYSKVFSSVDEGNTWIDNSENLTMFGYNPIVFEIDKKDRIFLSSSREGIVVLYYNSWVTLNSGLPSKLEGANIIYPYVECMTFDQEGNVYIGTSEGIFKGEKDIYVSIVNETTNQPGQFLLYQNYPNPFNPTTKINYQIPKTGSVTLKIYDLLGREVATLVNEEKPGGEYEVEFNASNLSSGVYFYRLQTGNFLETKKLILMR